MDSSNAEKAWDTVAQTREFMGCALGGQAHRAFMAGRASRDAEVAELTAMNEAIREVDGEEITYRDEVLIPRLEGERDEALKALGEARARYGDIEVQLAEAQAVIEKMRGELHHAEDNGHHLSADCQGVAPGEHAPAVRLSNVEAVLSTARSVVLEDRDREVAARAVEAAADRWVAYDCNLYAADRLRERAEAIRRGDTNA